MHLNSPPNPVLDDAGVAPNALPVAVVPKPPVVCPVAPNNPPVAGFAPPGWGPFNPAA